MAGRDLGVGNFGFSMQNMADFHEIVGFGVRYLVFGLHISEYWV